MKIYQTGDIIYSSNNDGGYTSSYSANNSGGYTPYSPCVPRPDVPSVIDVIKGVCMKIHPANILDLPSSNTGKFVSNSIKKVIFNDPCTIVLWKDNTKTVVKCNEGDTYNKEAGLSACIIKKLCGNKGSFNDIFREFCGD